jgi:choline dehydrogenase-like flavoprotein
VSCISLSAYAQSGAAIWEAMEHFDFVIIGSGFGGSVAALRLVEKGYRVLVLEQGRRFSDSDFPRTNWHVWDYLWMPSLRLHGFMRLTFLKEAMVLDGCGVGGGSLVYANVLMEPDAELFEEPEWTRLADWRTILSPHYETARAMLGVAVTPKLGQADLVLHEVAIHDRALSGRRKSACSWAARISNLTLFWREGQPAPGAFFAAVAWSVAATMPRTHWSRTTCTWRRSAASPSDPKRR